MFHVNICSLSKDIVYYPSEHTVNTKPISFGGLGGISKGFPPPHETTVDSPQIGLKTGYKLVEKIDINIKMKLNDTYTELARTHSSLQSLGSRCYSQAQYYTILGQVIFCRPCCYKETRFVCTRWIYHWRVIEGCVRDGCGSRKFDNTCVVSQPVVYCTWNKRYSCK